MGISSKCYLWIKISSFFAFLSFTSFSYGTIIVNPGFEDGLNDWQYNDLVFVTDYIMTEGLYSGAVECWGNWDSWEGVYSHGEGLLYQDFFLPPGVETISFDLRAIYPGNCAEADVYLANLTTGTGRVLYWGFTDGWETLSYNISDFTGYQVRLSFEAVYQNPSGHGIVLVDNINIHGLMIPEPASFLLLGTGLIALLIWRKKQNLS